MDGLIGSTMLRASIQFSSVGSEKGYYVDIDAVYTTRTYGGLLEGLPTQAMNQRLIEDAKKTLTKIWGQRSFCVVPYEADRAPPSQLAGSSALAYLLKSGEVYERLPPYWTALWLSSDAMRRRASGGSCSMIAA